MLLLFLLSFFLLLLFLSFPLQFFFCCYFVFCFFFSVQEHPGKSFRVLYFHLSPGLLWTAEVIVRVNFRDLKGSNLKASAWKCKLQLECCQVLRDGTWRCCRQRNPCTGTAWTCAVLPSHSLCSQQDSHNPQQCWNEAVLSSLIYKWVRVMMWLDQGHLCKTVAEGEETILMSYFQVFPEHQSREAKGMQVYIVYKSYMFLCLDNPGGFNNIITKKKNQGSTEKNIIEVCRWGISEMSKIQGRKLLQSTNFGMDLYFLLNFTWQPKHSRYASSLCQFSLIFPSSTGEVPHVPRQGRVCSGAIFHTLLMPYLTISTTAIQGNRKHQSQLDFSTPECILFGVPLENNQEKKTKQTFFYNCFSPMDFRQQQL